MNYRLKMAILRSHKKQIQIARETQIAESRLSKIIHGHIAPTYAEKINIALALSKNVDELFFIPGE